MTITRVIIEKNEDITKPKLLATATIHIDYGFAVNDIKLMTGAKGEYLIFPTDKVGRFVAYPIKNESREYILDVVLDEFNNQVRGE